MSTPDPLSPKALPGPGLRQWLREAFTGRPTPLLCMQVEVSSVCACRCTYCPHTTKKDVWQSRLMSAETFAALWPLMRQCGRVHLQGWGEPFLHPRFMDFVSVARRAGCAVSTTTCGQHMDESLAAAIVDSGMDVVAFSLAGTDEASNASRQGIPFSRVCEAIRCLREVRRKKQGVHLEVHLAYLLLPSQLEAVKRLPELMEELDVHCAVVSTMDYIASPELAVEAYSPEEADKVAAAAAPPGSWPSCGAPGASGISAPLWQAPGPTCPVRAAPSVSRRSGRAGGSSGMRGEGKPFWKKVSLPPSSSPHPCQKLLLGRMTGQGTLMAFRWLTVPAVVRAGEVAARETDARPGTGGFPAPGLFLRASGCCAPRCEAGNHEPWRWFRFLVGRRGRVRESLMENGFP